MITTVNELKIGDKISFIDTSRPPPHISPNIITIKDMELTSNKDNEWFNPWTEDLTVVLCYRITFIAEDYPDNNWGRKYVWSHKYTLNYQFYKHQEAPLLF